MNIRQPTDAELLTHSPRSKWEDLADYLRSHPAAFVEHQRPSVSGSNAIRQSLRIAYGITAFVGVRPGGYLVKVKP